jgi:septal ring-binding cell division protein DamX
VGARRYVRRRAEAGRERATLRTRERIRPPRSVPSRTSGITSTGNGYGFAMRRLFRSLIRLVIRLGVMAAIGAIVKRLLEGSQPSPASDGWAPTALTQPAPTPASTGPKAATTAPAASTTPDVPDVPDEVDTPAPADGTSPTDASTAGEAPAKKAPAKKAPAKKAAAKKAPAKKAAGAQGGSEEE